MGINWRFWQGNKFDKEQEYAEKLLRDVYYKNSIDNKIKGIEARIGRLEDNYPDIDDEIKRLNKEFNESLGSTIKP